ncbi:capsule assembly Wzi family protein [Rhodothermus marinus]|uniref:Capsule assembly Wzi family protein n=1 Tax=Rhodothermus marinus (strain ATCC 43812 / DSM 4252 / R-10) TaxID=518766 RepID=D0MGP9_RHOM4|nr:capsule assembly Wzi family protein [Rhodothermus marinus]ACY49612.1 hypothetical protein Rmar_2742 [Rhodothermus marinus DSM 4252]
MRKVLIVLLLGGLSASLVRAQALSSLRLEGELGVRAATAGRLPFWLAANQWGRFDPKSANGYVLLNGQWERQPHAWLSYGVGGELLLRRAHDPSAHFVEAYGRVRVGFLEAHVGRRREIVGTVDTLLSSGAPDVSPNATPIPKIVVRTPHYTSVPGTRGWVQFHGYWAHGWMKDVRQVEDTYLHQKYLYLRFGPGSWRIYAGLVHQAFWGGTSRNPSIGRLPQGLDDYFRTFFALNAGEGAPRGEQIYIQGDHFGTYDFGFSLEGRRFGLLVYRHFFYEDRDGLKFKNPQDGLLGLALRDREGRLVERVVYEFLYTKRQSGPIGPGPGRGGPGGRDNYYNHYIYRTGWTHYGRTVGSPLMFAFEDRAKRLTGGVENNRVVAHHLGLAGRLAPALRYRLLATYSRNYGTYNGRDVLQQPGATYRFEPPPEQLSVLMVLDWQPDGRPLAVQVALAGDVGQLYPDNLGLALGVRYRPMP